MGSADSGIVVVVVVFAVPRGVLSLVLCSVLPLASYRACTTDRQRFVSVFRTTPTDLRARQACPVHENSISLFSYY
jgi:hypothetical protein